MNAHLFDQVVFKFASRKQNKTKLPEIRFLLVLKHRILSPAASTRGLSHWLFWLISEGPESQRNDLSFY